MNVIFNFIFRNAFRGGTGNKSTPSKNIRVSARGVGNNVCFCTDSLPGNTCLRLQDELSKPFSFFFIFNALRYANYRIVGNKDQESGWY
jgi:hypothetical protein